MRRVLTGVQAATAIALFLGPATAHLAAQDELARQARTILAERCHACHGDGGSAEGGLNFVLDRRRLVERKKIVPGDASQSLMFRQVKSGNMPKDDDPLSAAEIDTLKRWIEAGAPDFNPAAAQREFISSFAMMDFMQHDLESVEERLRPFVRYFTITHLYNAGLSDDELETYRVALSKLVNSLSWGSEIVRPKPIDPAMTVFRIDINDFGWTEKTWDCVIACNPYAVTFDMPAAKFCYSATKCALPHVRADWFVAAAAVPPLYHEILLLPTTDRVLEIRLHVDVARNQRTGRAARAGFNGSGVSTNNRLIERHGSTLTGGAYWKSYDFSGNDGKKNLFAHPIGPGGTNGFEHDGGEIIFNLPNGLQAYFLTDGKGTRIDKGPIAIVRDPRRPDSAVVNGLSCMSCHSSGMIPKDDQVRATVLATSSVYKKEEVEIVKALYPEKADFDALLRTDAERFANAVAKAGGQVGGTEPIVTLALRFEEELDVAMAAAEAGLTPAQFKLDLETSSELARALGPLLADGTIKRDVFVGNFGRLVRELALGIFHAPVARPNPATSSPSTVASVAPRPANVNVPAQPTQPSTNKPAIGNSASGRPVTGIPGPRMAGRSSQFGRPDIASGQRPRTKDSMKPGESTRIVESTRTVESTKSSSSSKKSAGPLKSEADIQQALTELRSGNTSQARAAAERFSVTPPQKSSADVPAALLDVAKSGNHFSQIASIRALAIWHDKNTVPALIAILPKESDAFVRGELFKTLGKLNDDRAIAPIVRWMDEFASRHDAIAALKQLGPKAEQAVLAECASTNREHLQVVCEVLGEIGTKTSIPWLEKLSVHQDFFVKNHASRALKKVLARSP